MEGMDLVEEGYTGYLLYWLHTD